MILGGQQTHMSEPQSTRRISKPLLMAGVVLAAIAWILPLLGFLPHTEKAVATGELYVWMVAWPAVYCVGVGFVLLARRFLDLRTTAFMFGAPNGPAPRWAHLCLQLVCFTGPPISIILSIFNALLSGGTV